MNRNEAGKAIKSSSLPPTDRHVFHALLDVADNPDCRLQAKFTPTIAKLSEWTGYARATVYRSLAHLELHNWVGRRSGGGRGRKTFYELIPMAPDAECHCEKVARRDPFSEKKGLTSEHKGSHQETQTVSPSTEFPQVKPNIGTRDSRDKGNVYPCDKCPDTNTQLVGPYRLCPAHAGPGWKKAS